MRIPVRTVLQVVDQRFEGHPARPSQLVETQPVLVGKHAEQQEE